jgi:hypothetical protein
MNGSSDGSGIWKPTSAAPGVVSESSAAGWTGDVCHGVSPLFSSQEHSASGQPTTAFPLNPVMFGTSAGRLR